MKWLKHDTDAHRDAKLRRVMIKYGMEGYGLYWYLLENVAAGITESNLTFELEHDSEIVAHDTGIHHERVEEIIMFMVRQGLFEESQGVITCLKLLKRLDTSITSNRKFRKDILKAKESHGLIMIESGQDHDFVMTKSRQSHERSRSRSRREVEENKHSRRFTPPSESDVAARIDEMGYKYSTAEDFCNFYGSKNWMVGKNKMTDWHKALGGWESRKRKDAVSHSGDHDVAGVRYL